jgi:hypothetical protein
MKFLKKTAVIFTLLLTLVLFSTCKKENMCDCIKRTGDITTKIRETPEFNSILVENNINVFITEAINFEVKIEAGENLISLIKTEVSGNFLSIKNKNRCNWTRSYDKPINVYIKMPLIKYIISDGTGNIKGLNTITSKTFDVQTKNSGNIELTVNNDAVYSHMHGSADITLYGTTKEHACSIGGTGYLNCKDLNTNYTWLHTFTIGQCYVSATDLLICKIDQIGDVYCYSNPASIQKTINGKGQLYLK